MDYCVVCGTKLKGRQTKFCSYDCKKSYYSKYKNQSKKSIESSKRASKRIYHKKKQKIEEIFGCDCFICKSIVHLLLHKKDGSLHHKTGEQTMNEAIANPKQFSRICMKCHIAVHWIMKHYGWIWEQIIERLIKE